ncbi:MAG: hypothetical protein ABI045_03495 [Flavobacteriales bacterium]
MSNDGSIRTTCYQISILLEEEKIFGQIQNLKLMDHFRLLMKDFSETTTLYFTAINLVGTCWRVFAGNMYPDDKSGDIAKNRIDTGGNSLVVCSIYIEQNGKGNLLYILPSDVRREEFINIASL